jgi:phosphohistidine phosphatase
MDFYIVRHGEAGKSLSSLRKDRERSLTATGRRQTENLAKFLQGLGLKFDEVVTSPLPRARETAELLVKGQRKVDLQVWEELRPEGDKEAMLSRLAKLGHNSKVLLVGHEPYLGVLIADLLGAEPGTLVLKKGGIARVRITTFSPRAKGEFRWLLSPRVLKRI